MPAAQPSHDGGALLCPDLRQQIGNIGTINHVDRVAEPSRALQVFLFRAHDAAPIAQPGRVIVLRPRSEC